MRWRVCAVVMLVTFHRNDAFILNLRQPNTGTCTGRKQVRTYGSTPIAAALPGATADALAAPSLLSSAANAVAVFSKTAVADPSVALASVTEAAMQTPPMAYFLALMAAGCGVPVSEDAIAIFAGTVLTTLDTRQQQFRLLIALYLGVVLSDVCTFVIGRSLRMGVLDPVRKRLGLMTDDEVITLCDLPDEAGIPPDETTIACRPKRRSKRDRLKAKLENSGNWIGFVVRMSVGVRGPMMLLTGFSGRIPLSKFLFGSALGGVVSLGIQLLLGYWLKDNPKAVVGILASVSTLVCAGPLFLAAISSLAVLFSKRAIGKGETSSSPS